MERKNDLRECFSCSCFAARRAARLITQHYDRELRPTGLRATQFSLLVILTLAGPMPLSVAADRMGMERTTLTRNLRRLVARGLIVVRATGDRRVRMLAATARGTAAARAALPRWRTAQRSMADRLGTSGIRTLNLAAQAAAEISADSGGASRGKGE